MPAVSKSQQRLMGQAYALKKGDLKLKDLNPKYRDQIKDLADGMTLKQLKDYAETSHENLPDTKESVKENSAIATLGSVNGMGAPAMPGNPGSQESFATQETGSGDIPFALSKGQPKKKKNSTFKSFVDFIKGSSELRSAF
jgi:hypothetical protein